MLDKIELFEKELKNKQLNKAENKALKKLMNYILDKVNELPLEIDEALKEWIAINEDLWRNDKSLTKVIEGLLKGNRLSIDDEVYNNNLFMRKVKEIAVLNIYVSIYCPSCYTETFIIKDKITEAEYIEAQKDFATFCENVLRTTECEECGLNYTEEERVVNEIAESSFHLSLFLKRD